MAVIKGLFNSGGSGNFQRTTDGTTVDTIALASTEAIFMSRDRITGLEHRGTTAVRRTTDGGDSWSTLAGALNEGNGCRSLLELANGTMLAGLWGSNARVDRSTDVGASWSSVTIDGANPGNDTIPGCLWELSTGTVLIGVLSAAGRPRIYRSTNSGSSWTQVFEAGAGATSVLPMGIIGSTIIAIHQAPGAVVPVTKVIRSVDDGVTWSERYTSANDGPIGDTGIPRNAPAYLPTTATWVYWTRDVNAAQTYKHSSTDDGVTWSRSAVTITPTLTYGVVSTDNDILYMHSDTAGNQLHQSTDGGVTWTLVAAQRTPSVFNVALTGPTALTPATPAGIGLEIEIAPARIQLLRENYKPVIRIY